MKKPVISTLGNHFQISYGPNFLPFRPDGQANWNVRLDSIARPPTEWRAELLLAAQQIAAEAQAEVCCYLDGSFASQAMLQAFKWSRIPCRAIIPRFLKNFNIHSMSQAVIVAEQAKVPYEIVDIDVEKFFDQPEALAMLQKYSTDRVDQLVAMKIWSFFKEQNRFMVFPFGFPLLENQKDGWKVIETERDYGIFQYQKDVDVPGVSCFFKWSPEVNLSFLQDPILRAVVTNIRPADHFSDVVKKEVLNNYFLIFGDNDWHGFEKCGDMIKKFYVNVRLIPNISFRSLVFTYADYFSRLQQQPSTQVRPPAAG